jgi:hypothetical protein
LKYLQIAMFGCLIRHEYGEEYGGSQPVGSDPSICSDFAPPFDRFAAAVRAERGNSEGTIART